MTSHYHGQTVVKSRELQASGSIKFDHNNVTSFPCYVEIQYNIDIPVINVL